MIFSDRTIKSALETGDISIEPLHTDQIQPSSVDVSLGRKFFVFESHEVGVVDPREQQDLGKHFVANDETGFIIHPGQFVLGGTVEHIELCDHIVARIEGKSSLGRIGLLIHATAGFIDAGFTGQITLELSNVSRLPIRLWPGMKIGQISFMQMTTPADRPYGHPGLGSKYQGNEGAQTSRYFQNHH